MKVKRSVLHYVLRIEESNNKQELFQQTHEKRIGNVAKVTKV